MESQVDTQTDHLQVDVSPRISHAALLLASQVAKWSLRLIFVLVIARTLGPEQFGVYALVFALVEFLAVASGTGYADFLTREAAKDARAGWGLAYQLFFLRVAIAAPLAGAGIGILFLLRYPHQVIASMAMLALTVVPRSLSEGVQGVLRGIHRYGSYLTIELALGGCLVAGAIFQLVRHGGLGTAIFTEVVATSVAGLTAFSFALMLKTKQQIWLNRSHLLRVSAVFNLYSFVGSIYDRFDVVLLSRLAGDYATGIYSVAYRALSMTQIGGYGVLYSLLPALSRDPASREERLRLEKAMSLLLSAAFGIVLATMVFAGPAVRLLLGPRYSESADALKILIWAVILRYLNYVLNIALLAAGRERVFVITSLVCLGVNFVMNLALIPLYGWRAAAVTTIITELALLAQNIYWTRRITNRVGLPRGIGRTSLVFLILLGFTLAAGRAGLTLVAGTASLLLFGLYLYSSGMATEFATIWSAERSSAA